MLGLTYATVEKFELAEEPLRRGCTLDPAEELACHYLGMNYLALSRYEDARKAFEISLRADAKNRRRAVLGMGIYEEAVGNNAAAERNYRAAVEAGNPEAPKMLGMFLYRNGRGQEAVDYLRRANAKVELERVLRALASTPAISSQGKTPASVQFEARPLPMIVKNGASGEKHQ